MKTKTKTPRYQVNDTLNLKCFYGPTSKLKYNGTRFCINFINKLEKIKSTLYDILLYNNLLSVKFVLH